MKASYRHTLSSRLGTIDKVDEGQFFEIAESIFKDPTITLEPASYRSLIEDISICWELFGPNHELDMERVSSIIPDIRPQ